MKTPFISFLILFIPIALVLFGIQHLITEQFFATIPFYYSLLSIYLFHCIITLLAYAFLLYVHNNFSDKTGFTFMGMGVLKMMACIVFLIPMIQSDTINRIPDVIAFFIPYFIFLLFETIFAVRLINKS